MSRLRIDRGPKTVLFVVLAFVAWHVWTLSPASEGDSRGGLVALAIWTVLTAACWLFRSSVGRLFLLSGLLPCVGALLWRSAWGPAVLVAIFLMGTALGWIAWHSSADRVIGRIPWFTLAVLFASSNVGQALFESYGHAGQR
jgi:hypothetical protein